MIMRKTLILMFACMCLAFSANAQRNSGRLSLNFFVSLPAEAPIRRLP